MSREDWINEQVDKEVIPGMMEFIKIPNQSPNFDPNWNKNGLLTKVAKTTMEWVKKMGLENLSIEVVDLPNRTPLLFGVIDTPSPLANIMIYGHLDKQPPGSGWAEGLGPYTPVLKDGFLYGRGSSDDGFAIFSAVLMIKALQREKALKHRVVLFFETGEESGSPDIEFHLLSLKDQIRTPDMIWVMDCGVYDHDRIYLCTSLRGLVNVHVTVTTLKASLHSGSFGGLVPDPFRVFRKLINDLEDVYTASLAEELSVAIPTERYAEIEEFLAEFGGKYERKYPWKDKTKPMASEGWQLIQNRTWKPILAVIGQNGLPTCSQSSNLIHDKLTFKISIRLPPTLDPENAKNSLEKFFKNTEKLYGAQLELSNWVVSPGYSAYPILPAHKKLLSEASNKFFGKKLLMCGDGGSIPIVLTLQTLFGQDPFYLPTGVTSSSSNLHGPNENLNISYLKKFISSLAQVLENFRKA